MVKQADKYDARRGAESTFFFNVARHAIINHLRLTNRHNVQATSLEACVTDESGNVLPQQDVIADRREVPADRMMEAVETVEEFCLDIQATSIKKKLSVHDYVKADRARAKPEPKVEELRQRVLDSVSADDVGEIMEAVLKKAKAGHTDAVKLILDYVAGGKGIKRREG